MITDEMSPLSDRATIAEAAALLDLHPNSVRTRVKAGQYPSEKVLTKKGEAYLIPRAAIDAELRGEPLPPAGTYTPGASAEAGIWIVAPAGTPRQTTGNPAIIDQDGRGLIAASTPGRGLRRPCALAAGGPRPHDHGVGPRGRRPARRRPGARRHARRAGPGTGRPRHRTRPPRRDPTSRGRPLAPGDARPGCGGRKPHR